MCLWVSVGRELFFFFLSSALALRLPCLCNQTQNSSNQDFRSPFCPVVLMSATLHLSGCTHKPYASIFVCMYISKSLPPPFAFLPARALKQESSACVSRYRCPPCVIEDDEEAARVRGYCSWTTYKSKRQSICN